MNKLIVLFSLAFSISVNAEIHQWKKVSTLHSGDTRNCVFFQLEDVSIADSTVTAGGAWFAVHHDHKSSERIFSMLLAAKASGAKLTVATTGVPSCGGHVEVSNVVM